MSESAFITSDSQLSALCEQLSVQKIIAVDLEADSMHCFAEKICLIQVAGKDMAWMIDPFEISDMSPFLKILEHPCITKVFHGADFDVRNLDRQWGTRIQNLFDTQIACRFLNIEKQGLGDLLERFFHVTTDKRFQKYNWAVRPLPHEMMTYALADVAHLIELHDILVKKLVEKKRLAWVQEECDIQAKVRYESPHTLPLFKKFKGAGKLDKKSLAILENLLLLRQKIAQKKDQPLYKIMSSTALLEMTRVRPKHADQILQKKILSKKQAAMYADACLEAIKDALAIPEEKLPEYPRQPRQPVSPTSRKRTKKLKELRQTISAQLQMEPGFVLNNKTIAAIAESQSAPLDLQACGMKHWQIKEFGQKIIAALAGT